ncbi:CopG family transcriptional regulator [Candidatus Curtissbacteria bacterium]|nr:CopG family transcriptional regulator [Candidatus Curtissbacteria bacterium]
MLRINIYIPDDLNKKLDFAAKSRRKAKAEVIREALNHGLQIIQPKSGNAQALLDLAKMAKKIPTKGKVPKDFSKNLDYYTWGGEKRD